MSASMSLFEASQFEASQFEASPETISNLETNLGTNLGTNLDPSPAAQAQEPLAALLKHPDLWQAGQLAPLEPTLSSGFASLDENLPGNGWPQAGLAEFMLSTQGLGELQLLIPLLKRLSEEERWIAWVNPPFLPYAPALAEQGIDLNKILLIHPKNHKDALWAMECASKSGTCSIVLGWLDEKQTTAKDTRRLQLAAKAGNTFSCLFRPEEAAEQASMAELRISLKPVANSENRVRVAIEKRRRGWPVKDLPLDFTHAPYAAPKQQAVVAEQLGLWRAMRQTLQNTAILLSHKSDTPEIDEVQQDVTSDTTADTTPGTTAETFLENEFEREPASTLH